MSLAAVHLALGIQHHERGDFVAAEHAYRSAIRLAPDMIEPLINLSAIAAVQMETCCTESETVRLVETAFECHGAVLRLDPDQMLTRINLGTLGRLLATRAVAADEARLREAALACYRSALSFGPDGTPADPTLPVQAYFNCNGPGYVDFLLQLGQEEEAVVYLRRLSDAGDEEGRIAGRLHQVLFRAGRFDEAIVANDVAYERARAVKERGVASDESQRLGLELFLGRHRDLGRAHDVFRSYADFSVRDWAWRIEPNLANGQMGFPQGTNPSDLRQALDAARPLLGNPAIGGRRKQLVTALLVRDEIDLLADTIASHLNQGVDLVLVTDNGSVDGSRDLLADLERSAPVQVLDEPRHNHDQALWMTRMVHLARDQHGAEWVVCGDADEIWLAEEGDLPRAIAAESARYGGDVRIVYCRHSLMLPERTAADAPSYRPTDARLALVEPLRQLPTAQPTERIFAQYYDGQHQSIVRTDGFVGLWHGNHYAYYDTTPRFAFATSIHILHFHVRTRAHLRAKLARVRAAMEGNTSYGGMLAKTELPDADRLFDVLSYPTPFLERMRAKGRLTEIEGAVAVRDRPLPARDPLDASPDMVRDQAAAYFAAIQPYLPRAGHL